MTRTEATEYLDERYTEQLQKFPRLNRIPRDLYIRRNLHNAMKITTTNESEK